MSKYVTYHNHDTMSLLDSCLKTKDLVSWAIANNMKAVGVTNHGEMSSLLSLYKECKKQGIKPILGEEFYVTENKLDEEGKRIRDNHHLIVLCKNYVGWKNMIKLHNLSWLDDRYYYDPRITIEDLIKHKEGLIITSACIGGVLGKPWMENNEDKSIDVLKILQKEFGEDFYLELHEHKDEDIEEREKQHKYNRFLMRLSKEYGIKCVIQNDSHYYLKEDWEAHQVLLCKNTGSKLSNPRFKFGSKEYYLKNEVEMIETFDEYPLNFIEECISNTLEIASKIEEYDITNKTYDCPTFGEPEETYKKLVELTKIGLLKRFGKQFLDEHPEYLERIRYELSVVKKLNFVDYFLMLEDLISYTNANNIYTGIGRGSCVGSLVLYCLGVVHADPIEYNLLFERFLNEDRISMCDCDEDISDVDRPKVIEYVKNKFGKDHVCNIGTYGELTAKASLKAVASILDIPFNIANNISSIMDSSLSLKENYEQIQEFRESINENDDLVRAYKIALKLEGTYAQRGLHACGMVISSKPLDEVCGCITVKDKKTGDRIISTTNEMKEVDGDLKLLKMDYLGLRNLSILKTADEYIQAKHGTHPDYKNLDVNDAKVYKSLSNGETLGVFQFESNLMRSILRKVKPVCIEDLSCITAMARPSCLESGLTESFIKRRNGQEEIVPILEGTEQYMKDSLQLPIYQENCMQLSRVMAGFSGAEADFLRKCIGKKDPQKLKAEREHFVTGAVNNGFTQERANEVFDIIEKFGGYGFNKSHAVGYSLMSYATAYYKVHYPVEYMCALLNSVSDDIEKLNLYIGECYRLGITLTPPEINTSGNEFVINDKNQIVFSLNAIKGLGKAVVNDIIRTRNDKKFESFIDFVERTTKVDKGAMQALLRAGAFNEIETNCKRWDIMCDYINESKNSKTYQEDGLVNTIYKLVGTRNARKSDKYIELANLKRELGGSKSALSQKAQYTQQQDNIIKAYCEAVERHFLQYTNYKISERINNEQELIGFNVSINPYKRWNDIKNFYSNNTSTPYVEMNELLENPNEYINTPRLHTVGLLSEIKELKTKRGDKMARLTFEYYGVKTVITVFPNQWGSIESKIQKGNFVSIMGKLVETNKQYSSEDYEIRMDSLRQLNVLVNENIKCIIDITDKDRESIDNIIKRFAFNERRENLPIEKIVIYKIGKGYNILNGLTWINNVDKLIQEL